MWRGVSGVRPPLSPPSEGAKGPGQTRGCGGPWRGRSALARGTARGRSVSCSFCLRASCDSRRGLRRKTGVHLRDRLLRPAQVAENSRGELIGRLREELEVATWPRRVATSSAINRTSSRPPRPDSSCPAKAFVRPRRAPGLDRRLGRDLSPVGAQQIGRPSIS